MASHMSAGRALELGYRNVFVMPEGTFGWSAQKLPLEPSPKAGASEPI